MASELEAVIEELGGKQTLGRVLTSERDMREAIRARTPFDGEGAYRYGGRWSSPGVRLSYTSEHQSLALLEYFVHLDKDDPPADLVLAIAEVPDDLGRERVQINQLPVNWREPAAPPELARIGSEFVKRGEHCLLIVPSVPAPRENNWLLNPEHPEFRRIVVRQHGATSAAASARAMAAPAWVS